MCEGSNFCEVTYEQNDKKIGGWGPVCPFVGYYRDIYHQYCNITYISP